MTIDKDGKLQFSFMEVLVLLVGVVGVIIALLSFAENQSDNYIDELAVYVQMDEQQRAQYLDAKSKGLIILPEPKS